MLQMSGYATGMVRVVPGRSILVFSLPKMLNGLAAAAAPLYWCTLVTVTNKVAAHASVCPRRYAKKYFQLTAR